MEAIYLCCIYEPWHRVMQILSNDFYINAAYYVAWDRDVKDDELYKKFPSMYVHSIGDAWKGAGFPNVPSKNHLDEKALAEISREELIALKMMDRLDPTGRALSFSDRQVFFRDLVTKWLDVIDDKDITLVISPSIPHRVFDYALYVAAQLKNIKFLAFQMTPFSDASFIIDNVDHLPRNIVNCETAVSPDDLHVSDYIKKRIDKVKEVYSSAVPDYMINQREREKKETAVYKVMHYLMRKGILSIFSRLNPFAEVKTYYARECDRPLEAKTNRLQLFFQFRRFLQRQRQYITEYEKEKTTVFDRSKPYVFVALHYQPEETTSPTAGAYVDQILLVQTLEKAIPENYNIVVKEHQSQLYKSVEAAAGRPPGFYRRLKAVSSRIYLVDASEDPFRLLDSASVTCTVSGTIGWESAIRGTPTLVFGRAWYENMPRVHKVKSVEDIKTIWHVLIEEKNKDMNTKIENFHASLEKFFIRAPHYKAFVNKASRSSDLSAQNITEGIVQYLNIAETQKHD